MKIVYSLWTKPLTVNDNTLGFNSLDDFFHSLIFSVNIAKNNYNNIHFYTDKHGLELIEPYKDKLPFTKIHCVLDEINWVPSQWWAYPKIYVYGLQDEPFMHIDNDAYLWDAIPQKLIDTHDFICQNYEDLTYECYSFYQGGIDLYKKHIPQSFDDIDKYHFAMNAGIFGALNEKGLNVFKSLYEESHKSAKSVLQDKKLMDFIDWDDYRNWDAFSWNITMEQAYPFLYAVKNQIKILTIMNHDIKWTHLLAGSKRNKKVINKVKKRVKTKNFTPSLIKRKNNENINSSYKTFYK